MIRKRVFAILGTVALLLAACSSAATPTPPSVATSTPSQVSDTPVPVTTSPKGTVATGTPAATATAPPTSPTTAQAKYGGILRTPRRGEDPGWDFMKNTGGSGNLRSMTHQVFNMPASWSSNEPKPCMRGINPELAESWKWTSDTTFEVKLRQGVRFHNKPPVNGRELTAEDMAYSYRRGFFTWPVGGGIKVVAEQVSDIVATDRYTVQFRTKGPVALLAETLAWVYSLVVVAKESGGPDGSWEEPSTAWIGSGPFMFDRYLPGVKTVLVRNPQYWEKGYPYVDRVEHLVMLDKATREAAMRGGKLDYWDLDVDPLFAFEMQKTRPDIQATLCPDPVGRAPGWIYLKMDDPVWKDVRVRRAAMLAVDRQVLIDKALAGKGVPMAPFAPAFPTLTKPEDLSPEAQKLLKYNPDEARRLLREAGYAEGKGPEFNIITTTRYGLSGPFPVGVELLERMFTDVGFKVKLNWQPSAAYMTGFSGAGTWVPGYNAGSSLFLADSSSVFARLHSRASPTDNKGRVSDAEYDALVEKWLVTVDPNKSWELAKAIQSRIIEQAYIIPTASGVNPALAAPWVKNFNYVHIYFPRPSTTVWLDK